MTAKIRYQTIRPEDYYLNGDSKPETACNPASRISKAADKKKQKSEVHDYD